MELVSGAKITKYCDRNRLTIHERLGLFIQVCQAIQHAHNKGVIHRDLKPSNILVTLNDGVAVPKVIDFGIAKATAGNLPDETLVTGFEQLLGTPPYMSPEQSVLSRLEIDTRSDIYSLGALLYELLTGKTPFSSKRLLALGLDELRRIIREEEPARPSARVRAMSEEEQTALKWNCRTDASKLIQQLQGDLDAIVIKCLQKQPGQRYQTAQELSEELGRVLRREPILARPIRLPTRAWRWCRRKPVIATLSAVTVLLLLAVAIGSPIAALKIERERQRVQRNVIHQYVASGNRLQDQGDLIGALPWFAKALEEDQDPARGQLHGLRLASALQQCPKILQMWFHNAAVIDAQFSPNGRWVLTASEDGVSQVWDVNTGESVSPPLKHNGHLRHALFTPDGSGVAAASEKSCAAVWDAKTGTNRFSSFLEEGHPGFCVNFSPDGEVMVTGGVDKMAQLWNARTGEKLKAPAIKPLVHSNDVYWAVFSPNGKLLLTRSGERTVLIWNARTGDKIAGPLNYRVAGHNPEPGPDSLRRMCEFSPDSRLFVIPCGDGTARICLATTGEELAKVAHDGDVRRASFSPDGRWLVTASDDGTARVWDVSTGKHVSPPLRHDGPVFDAAFSPDSRLVVTGSSDGTARVWDAQTGEPLSASLRHLGAVWRVSFSGDGQKIVTGSADYTARVWDWGGARGPRLTFRHSSAVQDMAFSYDSRFVATIDAKGKAKVWDISTGQPWVHQALISVPKSVDSTSSAQIPPSPTHALPETFSEITVARFNPTRPWLAIAGQTGIAQVWDLQTGQAVSPPLVHDGMVNHLEFSPDGNRLVTASTDHFARIWEITSGKILREIKHTESVNYATFCSDGKQVATATLTAPAMFRVNRPEHWAFDSRQRTALTANWCQAQLWDAASGKAATPARKLGTWVSHIAFSPDGSKAVTACSPRALTANETAIIEMRTGRRLPQQIPNGGGIIYSMFSPDGKYMATTSWDHTARVWDSTTGLAVSPWLIHTKSVHFAAFSPDSRLIVTASDDCSARVWNATTGEPVSPPFKHRTPVYRAFFSPDGRSLLTASVDGEVHVWELPQPNQQEDELLSATLLAGYTIDKTGAVQPLSPKLMRKMWEKRRTLIRQEPDASKPLVSLSDEATDQTVADVERGELERAIRSGEDLRQQARKMEDDVLRSSLVTSKAWAPVLEQWSKTIETEPEQSADFRHRSIVYKRLGQYQSALDDMREFLWKRGPVPPAQLGLFYLQLGEMRLRMGANNQAAFDFQNVLSVPPDRFYYLTFYYHALAHEHLGEFSQAIEQFSTAITLAAQHTNVVSLFYYDRAQNYLRLNDYSNASQDLQRAIELAPNQPRNFLELASLHLFGPVELRSADRSLLLAQNALDHASTNEDESEDWTRLWRFLFLDGEPIRPIRKPLSTLGIAYYRLDRFDEAVESLDKSIKTESPDEPAPEALLGLAMSHRRLGHYDLAQEYYTRAIGQWPRNTISPRERSDLAILRQEAEALLHKPNRQ
jgi:WD40 repeat protein/tetratricopeptide (TPR) repeat protein